jgi:hypothetical protein
MVIFKLYRALYMFHRKLRLNDLIGTPYLLSLGLSKSMMSLVWIAGPLSGSYCN